MVVKEEVEEEEMEVRDTLDTVKMEKERFGWSEVREVNHNISRENKELSGGGLDESGREGVRLTERQDLVRGAVSVIQRAPPRLLEVKPRLFLQRRSPEPQLWGVAVSNGLAERVTRVQELLMPQQGCRVLEPGCRTQQPGYRTQLGCKTEVQEILVQHPVKVTLLEATGKLGHKEVECQWQEDQDPTKPKRGRKSNQQQSDHLVCEVCGERAGKHSYYGGQVCPSCRAFFRRSVQSRYNETFTCSKGGGTCAISLLTRKNCQFCRYQKCIQAGMRPSWILSDEERQRRFHGRRRGKDDMMMKEQVPVQQQQLSPPHQQQYHQVHQLQSLQMLQSQRQVEMEQQEQEQQQPPPSPEEHLDTTPTPSETFEEFTQQEADELMRYWEVMRRCCTSRHDDIDPQMLTDILQITVHGTSFSFQTAQQLSKVLDNRARSCFTLLQEFQALTRADQAAILDNNLPLIHRFRQSILVGQTSMSWRDQVALLVGPDKLAEMEMHIPQDFSKSSPSARFAYRHLFTAPWCQSSQLEAQHLSLMAQISSWVDPEDRIQLTLLTLILAFNTDFLELENRGQVEEIQLKFVMLLQAYLRSCLPPQAATNRLAKALDVLAITRQILDITKKRLII